MPSSTVSKTIMAPASDSNVEDVGENILPLFLSLSLPSFAMSRRLLYPYLVIVVLVVVLLIFG